MNDTSPSVELYSIEQEILRLKERKRPLGAHKQEIAFQIGEIKEKLKTEAYRMANRDRSKLTARQMRLREEILEIDKAIAPINAEIAQWTAMSNEVRARIAGSMSLSIPNVGSESSDLAVQKVKALRNRYLDFAEDQTRVNSMRVMAAQFANELTAILSEVK